MTKQELQKLRDLPIEGVAERLGLRITRHKSLCPFHDDHTASLSYCVRKNTCRCFVCMDESMGTIDLVMRHLRLDFKEACKWLADAHNVILDEWKPDAAAQQKEVTFDVSRYERYFHWPQLSEVARRFLFDERRLDPRVIRWCKVSSWCDRSGVNWLQTPYFDTEGKLIGVQNRNLQPGASPRFRFPMGSQSSIYNLPVIKRLGPGESLYITEGCSDCWSMLSAGHKAIAIPSATLLTDRDKELLVRLGAELGTQFHMYPDQDVPGETLFLQLKAVLPNLEHHRLPPGCKDYSDYYVRLQTAPPPR